jgi:hypothetical protein
MADLQDDGLRAWFDMTREDLDYVIDSCDAFTFMYKGKDYLIEGDRRGFIIQDPRVGHNYSDSQDFPYLDHPGHEQAKTPAELRALPFLDGKTLFERFDELRFYDGFE